jgi:hypothetical protein
MRGGASSTDIRLAGRPRLLAFVLWSRPLTISTLAVRRPPHRPQRPRRGLERCPPQAQRLRSSCCGARVRCRRRSRAVDRRRQWRAGAGYLAAAEKRGMVSSSMAGYLSKSAPNAMFVAKAVRGLRATNAMESRSRGARLRGKGAGAESGRVDAGCEVPQIDSTRNADATPKQAVNRRSARVSRHGRGGPAAIRGCSYRSLGPRADTSSGGR